MHDGGTAIAIISMQISLLSQLTARSMLDQIQLRVGMHQLYDLMSGQVRMVGRTLANVLAEIRFGCNLVISICVSVLEINLNIV